MSSRISSRGGGGSLGGGGRTAAVVRRRRCAISSSLSTSAHRLTTNNRNPLLSASGTTSHTSILTTTNTNLWGSNADAGRPSSSDNVNNGPSFSGFFAFAPETAHSTTGADDYSSPYGAHSSSHVPRANGDDDDSSPGRIFDCEVTCCDCEDDDDGG